VIDGLWSLPRLPALRTAWRPTAAPWKSLRDSHSRLENAPLPRGTDAFPTGTTAPATTDQDQKGGRRDQLTEHAMMNTCNRGTPHQERRSRSDLPPGHHHPEWAFTFSGIGTQELTELPVASLLHDHGGVYRGRSLLRIIDELRRMLLGWRAYFGFGEVPSPLVDLEKWIRRRLRCYAWKQWGRRSYRELRRRGVSCDLAWNTSKSAHGPWRLSQSPALGIALPARHFRSLGLPSLVDA